MLYGTAEEVTLISNKAAAYTPAGIKCFSSDVPELNAIFLEGKQSSRSSFVGVLGRLQALPLGLVAVCPCTSFIVSLKVVKLYRRVFLFLKGIVIS